MWMKFPIGLARACYQPKQLSLLCSIFQSFISLWVEIVHHNKSTCSQSNPVQSFLQIFVNGCPMSLELVVVAVGPDFSLFTLWSTIRHKNVLVHIWHDPRTSKYLNLLGKPGFISTMSTNLCQQVSYEPWTSGCCCGSWFFSFSLWSTIGHENILVHIWHNPRTSNSLNLLGILEWTSNTVTQIIHGACCLWLQSLKANAKLKPFWCPKRSWPN